jgi:hypothetical protein
MGASKNNKIHGAAAEMLVAHELMRLNYGVCIPLSDSEPYDLIAAKGAKTWRIQVKATGALVHGGYRILFRHGHKVKHKYTKNDADFFVCVIYYPSGTGVYVIPISVPKSAKGSFWEVGKHARYPDKWPRCKWENYRNAWNQLV